MSDMGEADGVPPKSVVDRVFAVLECFRDGDSTLTLTEVAHRTGLPKSTAHRLTSALVERGALERMYGEFRLGLRLFELGGLAPRWHLTREAALPFMQDLFEATHETIHLGILDGSHVVYLEKIRGHRAPPAISKVGGRLPAHCTAVGKALLAFAPIEVQKAVLAGPLQPCTTHSITTPSVLRSELEVIARQGFAVEREEIALGLQCVAAPALNRRGQSLAALSVSLPMDRIDDVEQLAPAVRTAALGLSCQLAPNAYII